MWKGLFDAGVTALLLKTRYGPKAKIYFEKAQERIKETTNDVNWLSECIEGIHQVYY